MKICKTCTYPYGGSGCTNPGCYANPNVSEATKEVWRARDAQQAAETAERARIAKIRESSYGR